MTYLIIAVLAVILLYGKILFMPKMKQISSVGAQIKNLSGEIKRVQKMFSGKETLLQRRDALLSKINSYEEKLSSEKEIPALLEELSEMANQTGVKIDSIEPPKLGTAEKGKLYQEVPILIRGKSGYHQLGRFINRLENSARFMKVKGIDITGNTAGYGTHSFTLRAIAYVLRME